MANELTVQISLSFTKGNLRESYNTGSLTFSVSGSKITRGVQNIGTTDETLNLGDVATPGFLILRNLDGTNYVEVGPDGTNYEVKMKANEPAFYRVDGSAVHLKANTAACNVEYLLIED